MRLGTFLMAVALLLSCLSAAAEDWPPVYDIPQVGPIKIDGDQADWKDLGFRIECLAPLDGEIVPSSKFDSVIRLGWDTNKLQVLVFVADSTPRESDDANKLNDGDSVEFFIADRISGYVRFVVTPGVDGKHALRSQVVDEYDGLLSAGKPRPSIEAASRKTGAGYVLEAQIPLEYFGPTRELGSHLGLQIIINNSDRPLHRSRYGWFPADDTKIDADHVFQLKFSNAPSPPFTTAVAGRYEGLRKSRVTIVTAADISGKRAEISDGPPLHELAPDEIKLPLAIEKIGRISDRYGAYLTFPMRPLGHPYKSLNVYVDSKRVAQVTPPDVDAKRRIALSQIDVIFKPAVFASSTFPTCDFADPIQARELLGEGYSIKTTFYDAAHQQVETAATPGRYGAVVGITTDSGVRLPLRLVSLFRQKESAPWREEDLALQMALPPQLGLDPQVVKEQQPSLSEYMKWRFIDDFAAEPDTALLVAAISDSKPGDPKLGGRNSIWAKDQRWWFPLKQKLGMEQYKYLIHFPENYDRVNVKYPLLLFLHGSGERGDDLNQVATHGPPVLAGRDTALRTEFVVLSPQCPAGEWWSALQLDLLLNQITKKYRIDPDRIYVTGLSMGGYGTWELAAEYPGRFAAIAPICGAGGADDAKALKNLPAWVFHGQADRSVPFQRSVEMVEALKKIGGRVKFTPYPNVGHDSWTVTYDNPELYDWLLRQKRGHPAEPRAK
jgi:hypothetical protein